MVIFGDKARATHSAYGFRTMTAPGAWSWRSGLFFEEACLAVVAGNLEAFLRAWGPDYGLLLKRRPRSRG